MVYFPPENVEDFSAMTVAELDSYLHENEAEEEVYEEEQDEESCEEEDSVEMTVSI